MSNDLVAVIVFVANLVSFIWFGNTLTSINHRLGTIADHTERQTRLLAALANAATDDSKTR